MTETGQSLLNEQGATESVAAERSVATIRPATAADFRAMLGIFRRVIEAGDTYVHTAETSEADAHAYWFGEPVATYVAEKDGQIVGMYRTIANQRGRGSHVANASFMVDPDARGQGLGLALGRHCLALAKKDGFLAMQFNMVVSSNTRAVALWKKLGFAVVGTLPKAFQHLRFGLIDAYVMYRSL